MKKEIKKIGKKEIDLTLFKFQSAFSTEYNCLEYLSNEKWKDDFVCKKCSNTSYCKGIKDLDRLCTKCRYLEYSTAGTLFHKIKFPLVKVFHVVYFISTSKKGITSKELGRKLGLKQKMCWLFKIKLMKAMDSSKNFPLSGIVEVDETFVEGSDENAKGRKKGNKKMVVVAIEKKKNRVSRSYDNVIDKADAILCVQL